MRLRRPSTPLIASIVVHVVVAMLFVQALLLRRPLLDIFGRRPAPVGPVERIGFLTLPPSAGKAATAGKRGGNGRPVTLAPPPPPLVAPRSVPSLAPPLLPLRQRPVAPPTSQEPGTGPLIGGGGETRGVQPRYEDPRLWDSPGAIASAPKNSEDRGSAGKSPAERLDSVVASVLGAHNDSMRVAAGGSRREPGDWTIEHNGQKYGIDRKFIRLGPLSIPTAVLAMLPLNITNNPTVSDRERRFSAMHDEIFSQAARAINDADFQKAVRGIRERKERERREREQAKRKAADSSASAASTNK